MNDDPSSPRAPSRRRKGLCRRRTTIPICCCERVREVATGGVFLMPKIANRLAFEKNAAAANPLASLSARELEILRMLGRGLGMAEIAEATQVSYKTIANSLLDHETQARRPHADGADAHRHGAEIDVSGDKKPACSSLRAKRRMRALTRPFARSRAKICSTASLARARPGMASGGRIIGGTGPVSAPRKATIRRDVRVGQIDCPSCVLPMIFTARSDRRPSRRGNRAPFRRHCAGSETLKT